MPHKGSCLGVGGWMVQTQSEHLSRQTLPCQEKCRGQRFAGSSPESWEPCRRELQPPSGRQVPMDQVQHLLGGDGLLGNGHCSSMGKEDGPRCKSGSPCWESSMSKAHTLWRLCIFTVHLGRFSPFVEQCSDLPLDGSFAL